MKREEKNQLSRQKILESAIKEFGDRGYGLSSINTICSEGNISKGILYHYFKDKDELYLACVKEVFDGLTKAFKDAAAPGPLGMEEGFKQYFDRRMVYFGDYPDSQKIFCEAIVSPPPHLRAEIQGIKSEFDCLNVDILTSLLGQVKLCPGITTEEVVEIFRMYQDFVSVRYQTGMDRSPRTYEVICRKFVSVLLYGVTERRDCHE